MWLQADIEPYLSATMPIELPEPPSGEGAPKPPNLWVWLVLLVVCLAAGIVWTLLTWPKGQSTGTSRFWMQLLGYPTLACAVAFGLRLHFYEEACNYLMAQEEVLQADREEAIAFGSEPLVVIGIAYLCGMGSSGVSGRVAQKESALEARAPKRDMAPIRHTRLALPEEYQGTDRYRQVFRALLAKLDHALCALPSGVPFDVQLQLPGDADSEPLLTIWSTCWDDCGLRPTKARLLPDGAGLMALDTWLDECGGPALEKFTLFVALQLNDEPPANSAEVAVALLLGWPPMAQRRDVLPIAMLHRPVACETDGFAESLRTVALLGRTPPNELHQLWQSSLSKVDKAALLKSASEVSLEAAEADDLSGIHDIDAALGNPGVAASWFATALAVEYAQQNNASQLIACQEDTLRLAVVRPTDSQAELETT
ncbi:hypothetical protein [Cupriavidus metallidurans]|uniref:hypothetical protein n=1 Tax=Cupriavidus metallidurans TaxID=119219 RepID=UPI001319DF49|nr:hypothetical protein [Cupriavidus metallidurans]